MPYEPAKFLNKNRHVYVKSSVDGGGNVIVGKPLTVIEEIAAQWKRPAGKKKG